MQKKAKSGVFRTGDVAFNDEDPKTITIAANCGITRAIFTNHRSRTQVHCATRAAVTSAGASVRDRCHNDDGSRTPRI
jgi:hypothetical protein